MTAMPVVRYTDPGGTPQTVEVPREKICEALRDGMALLRSEEGIDDPIAGEWVELWLERTDGGFIVWMESDASGTLFVADVENSEELLAAAQLCE